MSFRHLWDDCTTIVWCFLPPCTSWISLMFDGLLPPFPSGGSYYSSKGDLLSPCEHVLLSLPCHHKDLPQSPPPHLKVQKTMGLPSPYHPNSNFPLLIPVFINLLIYGTNGKDPLQRVIPVFHTEMCAAN